MILIIFNSGISLIVSSSKGVLANYFIISKGEKSLIAVSIINVFRLSEIAESGLELKQ